MFRSLYSPGIDIALERAKLSPLYAIGHINGEGLTKSEWYVSERDIVTLEEAKEKARKFRQENPARSGWYDCVAVLDNNGYRYGPGTAPVFDPDFEAWERWRQEA